MNKNGKALLLALLKNLAVVGIALLVLLLIFLKEAAVFFFELLTNKVGLPWLLWGAIVFAGTALIVLVFLGYVL